MIIAKCQRCAFSVDIVVFMLLSVNSSFRSVCTNRQLTTDLPHTHCNHTSELHSMIKDLTASGPNGPKWLYLATSQHRFHLAVKKSEKRCNDFVREIFLRRRCVVLFIILMLIYAFRPNFLKDIT